MYVVVFSELKVVMLIESSYYQFLFKYYAKCNASQNSHILHMYIYMNIQLEMLKAEEERSLQPPPLPFGT